jgi:hypothetical protein
MIGYYELILLFIFLLIITPIYFLPSILACDKCNYKSVLLINIFFGWTIVGWIASLVWGLNTAKDPLRVYRSVTHNCCPKIEAELIRLKDMFNTGEISKDDYYDQSRKLIGNRI